MNNGITIFATGATSAGKILSLYDIQIVNGLQTRESIFRHFQKGSIVSLDKGVLVKVLVSSEPGVRDRIIRATNNQSLVEALSLHATDKLQKEYRGNLVVSQFEIRQKPAVMHSLQELCSDRITRSQTYH